MMVPIMFKIQPLLFMDVGQEAEECEWKMIHDPEMQLKDQTRWNESLLLSLGLLAPKTSNHIFNDSAFHKLPSTLELQSNSVLLL